MKNDVNKENLDLSTLIDLNSENVNNELNQSFGKLNRIINATKSIQVARKGIENQAKNDETVVHTGTDDHGDITRFMNGPMSEIVEWDENKINVVDVSDGKILFSGTQEEISNHMTVIQNTLAKNTTKDKKSYAI